jgi:hypothetical protein
MTVVYDLGHLADWVSGLGSLAAVVVAIWGFFLVSRQRRDDRKANELSVGYELMAVLLDLANHLKGIERHIIEHENNVTVRGEAEIKTYRAFNPLIGLTNEGNLKVPTGTTELLVNAKSVDLWNDLRLLFNRNRSITSLMMEYRPVMEEFIREVPRLGPLEAGKIPARMDLDRYRDFEGKLHRLDRMTRDIVDQVLDTALLNERVLNKIGPALKAYFGHPFLAAQDVQTSDEG